MGVQNTITRLEWENKRLKLLLKAAGLPEMWMLAYLKLDDGSEKSDHQSPQDGIASTAGTWLNALESLSVSEGKSPSII